MNKKNLSEYKRKYDVARHHAWAGSVLLAVLLAIRIFFETSNIGIDDRIILIIGLILVVYTLIAIVLTYRYRSGLTAEQKIIEVQLSSKDAEIEKERIKVEKKKAKAEAKKAKKAGKE
jgi:predicted ABC-type exoprotein transport system permease subunit